MKYIPILFSVFMLAGILIIQSCTETPESPSNSFDRSAMLTHYADDFIIPAYAALNTNVNVLKTKAEAFANAPDESLLTDVQDAWHSAFISFQYATPYNFGPAGEAGLSKRLVEEIAVFPIANSTIENNLSGTYDFTKFPRDARGFLAVEYLLFNDDASNVVDDFANVNRRQLLNDLIGNIDTRVSTVLTTWNTTYRDEFIANNGTATGSGTSMLLNEFVTSFEMLKNFKTAVPLGATAGGSPQPTKVEAFYSGYSAEAFSTHIAAIEAIWKGTTQAGKSGPGFKAYLATLTGGEQLISSTEKQFDLINGALNNLPEGTPFSEQVVGNPQPGKALQVELQNLTRYIKVEMASLMGIAITFDSNDGD